MGGLLPRPGGIQTQNAAGIAVTDGGAHLRRQIQLGKPFHMRNRLVRQAVIGTPQQALPVAFDKTMGKVGVAGHGVVPGAGRQVAIEIVVLLQKAVQRAARLDGSVGTRDFTIVVAGDGRPEEGSMSAKCDVAVVIQTALEPGQARFVKTAQVIAEHQGQAILIALGIEDLVQGIVERQAVDVLAAAPAVMPPDKDIDELLHVGVAGIDAEESDKAFRILIARRHDIFRQQVAPAAFRAFQRLKHREVDLFAVHPVEQLLDRQRGKRGVVFPGEISEVGMKVNHCGRSG